MKWTDSLTDSFLEILLAGRESYNLGFDSKNDI